jgi:hypothetical protein
MDDDSTERKDSVGKSDDVITMMSFQLAAPHHKGFARADLRYLMLVEILILRAGRAKAHKHGI